MGHAVDQNLLSLVQQDVKELITKYKKSEESLAQQKTEQTEIENIVTSIQEQQSVTSAQLEAVLEWRKQQMNENDKIVETLVAVEKTLREELLLQTARVEKGLAETDYKVEQLERGFAKTDDKVEQLEQGFAKTDDKVQQLEQDVRSRKMKGNQPGTFCNSSCQKKQNNFSIEVLFSIPVTTTR